MTLKNIRLLCEKNNITLTGERKTGYQLAYFLGKTQFISDPIYYLDELLTDIRIIETLKARDHTWL